jgi:hypothetical protein
MEELGRPDAARPRLAASPPSATSREEQVNLIYGIAAVANAHVFAANAHYVFGDLRTWGWITLAIGFLQLIAAGGVMMATSWRAGTAWWWSG